MLFGQDFGWRHHRRLQPVFHRAQRRQRRHHGLAAADIALQQAVHWMGPAQIALDLGPGAALRARQPERQVREQARAQCAGAAQRRRDLALALAIMQAHRQLLRQQLFQLHALPGRVGALGEGARVVAGPRMVQGVDGFAKRGHAEAPGDVRRQGFAEFALCQGLRDQSAQGRLPQSGRGRINRCQRLGQRRTRAHDAIARVNHLRPEETRTRLAKGAHTHSRSQRLGLTAVKIEKAHGQEAAVVLDFADELTPRAIGDLAVDHRALDLHRNTFMRLGDGSEPGLVFITQRQMQNQIELAVNAELCELRRQGGGRSGGGLGLCRLARPGRPGDDGAQGFALPFCLPLSH